MVKFTDRKLISYHFLILIFFKKRENKIISHLVPRTIKATMIRVKIKDDREDRNSREACLYKIISNITLFGQITFR